MHPFHLSSLLLQNWPPSLAHSLTHSFPDLGAIFPDSSSSSVIFLHEGRRGKAELIGGPVVKEPPPGLGKGPILKFLTWRSNPTIEGCELLLLETSWICTLVPYGKDLVQPWPSPARGPGANELRGEGRKRGFGARPTYFCFRLKRL